MQASYSIVWSMIILVEMINSYPEAPCTLANSGRSICQNHKSRPILGSCGHPIDVIPCDQLVLGSGKTVVPLLVLWQRRHWFRCEIKAWGKVHPLYTVAHVKLCNKTTATENDEKENTWIKMSLVKICHLNLSCQSNHTCGSMVKTCSLYQRIPNP